MTDSKIIQFPPEEAGKTYNYFTKGGGEVFIHGRDGKIRERNTYGHDPFPPQG